VAITGIFIPQKSETIQMNAHMHGAEFFGKYLFASPPPATSMDSLPLAPVGIEECEKNVVRVSIFLVPP
jgi:hypothetical protein